MKQKYLFIFLTILSAVFACEQIDESALGEKVVVEKVPMSFTAVIERDKDTKTVLSESDSENLKKVLWQPGDAIGVSPEVTVAYDITWTDVSEFTSTLSTPDSSSDFEGSASFASRYKAFYPYTDAVRDYNNVFIFDMPDVQKYVDGSFDSNAAIMVAVADRGKEFDFKNVCGIVALQLTGEKAVRSITFSGSDPSGSPVPLGGSFEVDPYADEPVMTPYGNSAMGYSMTLDCVKPIQLDLSEATPFYLMLPPATYESFNLIITTDDGELMLKSGRNLTITRSHIKPTSELEYVQSVPIDLSEHGPANSYIVSEAGLYSFDAGLIGNGATGIIDGAGFHTENPEINPAKVRVVWQDRKNIIEGLTLDKASKRVSFMATGNKGNALVAVEDNNGNIIWSWHIWATDQPEEQTYINGSNEYVMLDRNMGAVRADRGVDEQWKDAVGVLYQWGRKDPFTFRYDGVYNWYDNLLYTTSSTWHPIEKSVLNPDVFYGAGYYYWSEPANTALWNSTQKTIYDPCPAGYIVPHKEVWRTFSKNDSYWSNSVGQMKISGGFDQGFNFIYDGSNTTYYPLRLKIDHNGNLEYFSASHISLWSTSVTFDEAHKPYLLKTYYYTYVDSWLSMDQTNYMTAAHGVRCMKQADYVDPAKPQVNLLGIKDITEDGATIEAEVTYEGPTAVVERGIIWGETKDLNIDNGNVEVLGDGKGVFSVELADLQYSTKYYYVAYAQNESYISYSEVESFYTLFEGNAIDLSQDGTANSYIVPPVEGEYVFDASVKGNSTISVGDIHSVEVLWESTMNSETIQKGDLLSNVWIEDDYVHFNVSPMERKGNAVIAAKDNSGNILWSWHIWVVDFDPVETQQTYKRWDGLYGAKLMDRNLGAIDNTPGSVESFGLYYQWGRKDPFVIPGHMNIVPGNAITYVYYDYMNDTIENAVSHPTVVFDNASWNGREDLWQSSKTMYDPCPSGWKMPDQDALCVGLGAAATELDGYYQLSADSATPTAYIPFAGHIEYNSEIIEYLREGSLWLAERRNTCAFRKWEWTVYNPYYEVDFLASVRCMKDE